MHKGSHLLPFHNPREALLNVFHQLGIIDGLLLSSQPSWMIEAKEFWQKGPGGEVLRSHVLSAASASSKCSSSGLVLID